VRLSGLRKLLGEVLYRKHSYAGALEQFEWYLKEAPAAADIGTVQERVRSCRSSSRPRTSSSFRAADVPGSPAPLQGNGIRDAIISGVVVYP